MLKGCSVSNVPKRTLVQEAQKSWNDHWVQQSKTGNKNWHTRSDFARGNLLQVGGSVAKAFKNDVDRQELAYQKRLCKRQLIASWGVSCKIVSIFGNHIRNLFYIFFVGVEKHVTLGNFTPIILYLAINESMCQSFWPYRINMIGNEIMIECWRLESFKLGWTRSINKDGSLDTRRDVFFLCISFCFLKALHLHSITSTYGQAWPTQLRTSHSARQNRTRSLTCTLE